MGRKEEEEESGLAAALELRVDGRPDGCAVDLQVTFEPEGLLGTAYLLADLGAREAVVELTHRRLVGDLRAAG